MTVPFVRGCSTIGQAAIPTVWVALPVARAAIPVARAAIPPGRVRIPVVGGVIPISSAAIPVSRVLTRVARAAITLAGPRYHSLGHPRGCPRRGSACTRHDPILPEKQSRRQHRGTTCTGSSTLRPDRDTAWMHLDFNGRFGVPVNRARIPSVGTQVHAVGLAIPEKARLHQQKRLAHSSPLSLSAEQKP